MDMKYFKDFIEELNERVAAFKGVSDSTVKGLITSLRKASIDSHKIDGNLIWRGFHYDESPIMLVSTFQKEHSWYGLRELGQQARFKHQALIYKDMITKDLGIKSPIFVTGKQKKADQFGRAYIVVPRGKYRIWHSPIIKDSLTTMVTRLSMGQTEEERAENKAMSDLFKKSYKRVTKSTGNEDELILETERYWLIDQDIFEKLKKLRNDNPLPSQKLNTYSDLRDAIKDVLSYYQDL
jgi:hypothetical protein